MKGEWKMKVCKCCGKEITEVRMEFCNLECRNSFYNSEEQKSKRREYMKEYFKDEEHREKHRELSKKYWNSLSIEEKRKYKKDQYARIGKEENTKRCRDYRNRNREKYNAYYRERYRKMKNREQKEMKVCEFCGKEIIDNRRNFCNLECKNSFYNSEEQKNKKREYEKKYVKEYYEKYYSEEENRQKRREYYRERYRKMKNGEQKEMKVCKFCGKEIIEKKRKFCNLECRNSFYDSEEGKRREYMREYRKKYYEEESNRQKRKEYMRAYMKEYLQDEEHRKKHQELMRNYMISLPEEKKKEYSRKKYARIGREENTRRCREYIRRNREKWNAYLRERYHKIKNGEWKK